MAVTNSLQKPSPDSWLQKRRTQTKRAVLGREVSEDGDLAVAVRRGNDSQWIAKNV